MAKKKGPPYKDDPECVYIVIDNPWPWNTYGKARDDWYYNMIGAWVWYMLGKPHGEPEPHVIYAVNTRRELVVKLSEGVDVTPILGSHRGGDFLKWGHPKDLDNVACVFPYNYRLKGHPEQHGWTEYFPRGGEPPEEFQYWKWPYPKPHWVSLDGKESRDIALPLPPTRPRTPTPTPEPVPPPELPPPPQDAFQPYEAPAHYNPILAAPPPAIEQDETKVKIEPEALLYVHAKLDPYEAEEAALQYIKAEPRDEGVYVKQEIKSEVFDAHIKQEAREIPLGPEASAHQPSPAMVAAFERLQQRRQALAAAPQTQVKQEEPSAAPQRPSAEYVSAVERYLQRRQGQDGSTPQTDTLQATQVAHEVSQTQGRQNTTHENGTSMRSGLPDSSAPSVAVVVKPEPQDAPLPGPPVIVKPEPQDVPLPAAPTPWQGQLCNTQRATAQAEPKGHNLGRLVNELTQSSDPMRNIPAHAQKRLKTEEESEPAKRIKMAGR